MTLTVDFAHKFGDVSLDIGFAVHQPGVTALFGPSGAGKTTCVNVVAGLLRPDRGFVKLGGKTMLDTARQVCVPARRRRIGYVFQDARLFPHLNVARNLEFGAKRAEKPLPEAETDRIIKLLGLKKLLTRAPRGLSGGERQRVALARALMSNPKALLLDEPLASLDQGRKADIMPYLERLHEDARLPIVLVSHSIDEVTRLAGNMVVLGDGRVAASGPVDAIMSRLDLFPLTGRFEAGAVISGEIAAHDDQAAMTTVVFPGGQMIVPRLTGVPGQTVRLRVRSRDVMLALAPPSAISANNVLEGRVADLRIDAGAFVDVRLDCGGTMLLARITRLSRERLRIERGMRMWAVVKSVGVDRSSDNARRSEPAELR